MPEIANWASLWDISLTRRIFWDIKSNNHSATGSVLYNLFRLITRNTRSTEAAVTVSKMVRAQLDEAGKYESLNGLSL